MSPLASPQRPSTVRKVATGLVVGMGLGFLATKYLETHHASVFWGYARSFCEAGLVGALADWFAVVALFRHPLGQKWIPHTAILPKNQAKIAKSVASFFQENFFDPKQLVEQLRHHQLVDRLFTKLKQPTTVEAASAVVHRNIPNLVRAIDNSELKGFLRAQINGVLQQLPIAKLGSKLLRSLVDAGHHQAAFDQTLRLAGTLLEDNLDFVQERIEVELKRVPSLMGLKHMLTRQIAAKIVSNVQASLEAVIEDPQHPIRGQFHVKTLQLMEDLSSDEALMSKSEQLKEDLLRSASLSNSLESLWTQLKDHVLSEDYLESSSFKTRLQDGLNDLFINLASDENLREKLEAGLEQGVSKFVEEYGQEIQRMIENTILSWDQEEVASKLEEHVGDDLQFIRINGSVVGGAVGVILHAIVHALGW